MAGFSVVTGAFSYTGKYIAERLLALGQPVKTLTRHQPSGSNNKIEVAPLDFANRDGLVDALRGATTLRSEEHTSELQSRLHLVCRLLLEKKKNKRKHESN